MSKDIIVQKYGGTSVRDARRIKNVARRIIEVAGQGKNVVAVVSAPGNTTDRLMEMALALSSSPDERELDVLLATGEQQSISLLAMAIKELGFKALSYTGSQVGIITDSDHSRARIKMIKTDKLKKALKQGNIVIVAGFQGMSLQNNITTLGRGGSDLSAVAIASVLKADVCEIYTDVDGVYSTDPRIVPGAKKIKEITYDEMLEMASSGAGIMQSRSIEVAKRERTRLHIRSSLNEDNFIKGTLVMEETKDLEQVVVRGVTLDEDQVKISVLDVPDRPGVAAGIFGDLAKENINVDMIIQTSPHEKGVNDISFTINRSRLQDAVKVLGDSVKKIGAAEFVKDEKVSKVSIVGIGMRSHAGVAARMFEVLSKNSINIEMISTSEIKISCVVSKGDGKKAVRALHKEFCEK